MQNTAARDRQPVRLSSALASVQGSRQAQELLNILRSDVATEEALHWVLQAIRRSGDRVRLRAFTLEIQRALKEGQRRATDLRELRRLTDLQARLSASGAHLHRTDPADGPVTYFIALRGVVRAYVDLDGVEAALSSIEVQQESARRRLEARKAAASGTSQPAARSP